MIDVPVTAVFVAGVALVVFNGTVVVVEASNVFTKKLVVLVSAVAAAAAVGTFVVVVVVRSTVVVASGTLVVVISTTAVCTDAIDCLVTYNYFHSSQLLNLCEFMQNHKTKRFPLSDILRIICRDVMAKKCPLVFCMVKRFPP